ncbi:MAG TPA: ATP-dependent DNA helicase RecG [Pedomonas sp.]|uniref:ATP-dependent DNA helicase RecG n=1 Tax=Pedomonas sp. TaxID=2976421 RepID=UPI002F41AB48
MRPDSLFPLFAPATTLKGVGAALAKQLNRIKLDRVVDLIFHLPVDVVERPLWPSLRYAREGTTGTVAVTVADHVQGGPRSPVRVLCHDSEGETLTLVFFSTYGNTLSKRLPVGSERLVSGKLERFGAMMQMVHPDYIVEADQFAQIPAREPVYGLTEGVTNKRMRTCVQAALEKTPVLPEWIDPELAQRRSWPAWRDALTEIHAGEGTYEGRERLAYDEMFANQLALALLRGRTRKRRTEPLVGDGRLVSQVLAQLPFQPTGAQARAFEDVRRDLASPEPMLRLLQGDVGSGKTLVALIAMLDAAECGAQSALLAPTEILARQHFATLTKLIGDVPVRIALLTGREKGKGRAALLEKLAAGEIDILVGTHAIFQEDVHYHNLRFTVIDEQHRFGVHQRLMLTQKAPVPAHLLAMTATPIPRTLTLTLYGEMDVSKLDERPPGRQPIDTRVISLDRLEDVYAGLARAISTGAQAYWVCPLVEESEKVDLAAAEARAADLQQRFGSAIGLVHGKMKGAEKDAVMAAFQSGEIKVLVATTVIEVGVDVPNATLIIIEQAERFGLAQLHQLRGRVGRGSGKSTCLLLRGTNVGETARARLAMMRETDDGFRIAEEDLRLRGAGEILGSRQSGFPDFKLADPMIHGDLLEVARDDARVLSMKDPALTSPRGEAARTLLYLMERDVAAGLLRSG